MEVLSMPDGVEALLARGRTFITAAQRIVVSLKRAHYEHDRLPEDLETISLTLPIVTAQVELSMDRIQSGFWSTRNNELLLPIYAGGQKMITELTSLIEDMESEKEATNSDQVANTIRLNLVQESRIKKICGHISQLSHSLDIHNAEYLVDVSLPKPKSREVAFGSPCVQIPYERNENFVGRNEILEEIDEKLFSRRQVVLSGLGGIGKTEIASEFCWRHHKKYPHSHIFWLTASSPSSIREGYQSIARRVGLPYGRPELDNIVFETVADWLKRDENQPWLIVLDNADDLDTLKGGLTEKTEGYRSYLSSMPYRLGTRNGKTVITTRNSQVCRQVSRPGHISVLGLPTDDAVKLLRNQMSDDSLNREQLEDVVTKLDQLPLAIAQAARYIIETDDTMTGYLRKLEDFESRATLLTEDFGSDRRDSHQKNSVFGTWEMSFEQVQRIRPRAAEMLSFMSVLAPQMVPKQLLQLEGENEVQFDMAVATLLSFSLVKKGSISDEFQMHPLIHEATRMWIGRSLEVVDSHKAAALRRIERLYPEIDHNHNALWDLVHSLEPHANEVLQYTFNGAEELPHAQLLSKSAGYDWSQGRSEHAQTKYLQALKIYERDRGQHELQVIRIFHALGNVLCDLGKYDESLSWLEKAWDGVQALPIEHGPKSLHVCLLPSNIINSFGLLYKDQELDEEAEQHFKKAHRLAEQVVGPEHPHTLIPATNLAGVLRNQYRYEEAYHLHNDLIQRQKKVLGLENSVTLDSMENFVYLLSDLRRYDEAMKIHQQLEHGKEAVYGRSHRHELIRNKEALAYILECRADHDQKDHQRTLELRQEAYEAFKAHYGEDHEYTLDAGQKTARIMWRLENVAAAEELGRRVHQAMERRFGHDHSQTLSTFGEVITYVREQGRYEEAEQMRRRQLATLEEKRGDNDLEVFHCCASLGNTIQHQYKYHEAIPFFQRAYDGFCRKLGEDHDEAKECLRKLELARSNLEKEEEGLGTAPDSDEDDLAESLVTLVEEDELHDSRGPRSVDGSIAESFPMSPTLEEADIERYYREGFSGFVTYV